MSPLLLVLLLAAAAGVVIVLAMRSHTEAGAPPGAPRPGDAPYKRAISALLTQDDDAALRALTETVRADSDNVEAYLWLGDILRRRGDVDRSLAIHRELSVRRVIDPALAERVQEALVRGYIAAGRHAHAILAAEKLRSLNRQNRAALDLLADVHEALHDWERAYEVIEDLAKLTGRGAAFLATYKAYAARDYQHRGMNREALQWYKDALRLDGRCLPALLGLGDVYYADGKLDQAISLWRAVTMRYPALAHLVFGRLEKVYFEKGIFSDVFRIYEELLRDDPRNVHTLLALATMHQKKGDVDRALRTVREALEYDPTHVRARHHLVRLLAENGEHTAAMAEVDRILAQVSPAEGSIACARCNARSADVVWRCPACRSWDGLALGSDARKPRS
jgi:lipopolysaccharide biosynthesis regulator YciM